MNLADEIRNEIREQTGIKNLDSNVWKMQEQISELNRKNGGIYNPSTQSYVIEEKEKPLTKKELEELNAKDEILCNEIGRALGNQEDISNYTDSRKATRVESYKNACELLGITSAN